MHVTDSPVPTTGQLNPHALFNPEDDSIEAIQRDAQSFLADEPFPDRWAWRGVRTAEALLVRVVRLVKQPVIMILVLLLLAPAVLGATRDDDEDDLPETSRKTKGKAKDRPAPEEDEDEAKAGACPRGGQHVFKGDAKVTRFPIYGMPGCTRVLTSKTCSKCKSDVTYKVQMVGNCKGPGPIGGC